MRRNGHPSFPSAITCCFFSSLKTLLMPREPIKALLAVNVLGSALAGFQVTLFGRIWVTPEVDHKERCKEDRTMRKNLRLFWALLPLVASIAMAVPEAPRRIDITAKRFSY